MNFSPEIQEVLDRFEQHKAEGVAAMKADIQQAFEDAARWRYVRDNLVRGHSLHMDGTYIYHFGMLNGRGHSVDEVIDNLIREERERATEAP